MKSEQFEKLTAEIVSEIKSDNWEKADHLCTKSLTSCDLSQEETIWIYDNQGFIKYNLGKIEDALSCCNIVLDIDPEHAYAHKGKGINLANLGRVNEGIASLLKAIQCDPSFFDAYHDLAVVLIDAGRKTEAKQWAQRAYQMNPLQGETLLRSLL